jgi:DNA polymerase III subunit delta'
MQFSDVIGQAEVKARIVELFNHNRLSHALLFLGQEGSGVLPLAISFAQFLVCEKVNSRTANMQMGPSLFGETVERINPKDSCGICSACQKAAQLIHPDIHFSFPTVTTKSVDKPKSDDFISDWREFMQMGPYSNLFDWIEKIKDRENAQGKITTYECTEIIRKLSLKSFESEYKVMIIWMPETMGTEGNKLLKLIEEPPPNTLLILVAENETLVLPTITSRCQLIRVPALETTEIKTALVERHKTDPAVAARVAPMSEGNYREAMQLVQHAEEDWQALARDWLNAMLKSGPLAQGKWVEEVSKLGREKQKQFLRYFNHLLEQALHARLLSDDGRIGEKEKDFAVRINKISSIEQQQALIEEIDKAIYYLERNANAKILFHALTIKLYHIIQDKIVFLME